MASVAALLMVAVFAGAVDASPGRGAATTIRAVGLRVHLAPLVPDDA